MSASPAVVSAFSALTRGSNFDRKRDAEATKVFWAKPAAATKSTTTNGGAPAEVEREHAAALKHRIQTTSTSGTPSSSVSSKIGRAPPPPPSLSALEHFFGDDEGKPVEEHDASDDDDDDTAKAGDDVPKKEHTMVKLVNPKRAKNLRRKHELMVTGTEIPPPFEHFNELVRPPFNAPSYMVDNLFAREHRRPTPVQMQCIPALLQKRDVLSCAPTGSGKTLAFLLPMFVQLKVPNADLNKQRRTAAAKKSDEVSEEAAAEEAATTTTTAKPLGIRAIILTPTKELAMQIEKEALFLTKNGGHWKCVQHGQSTKGRDYFISTPARAATLVQSGGIDLSDVEYIVFDEGDQLYDTPGFATCMDTIVAACTKQDKTISCFSATLTAHTEQLLRSIMHEPIRVIVRGRRHVTTHVKQELVYAGNEGGKIVKMRQLIQEGLKMPCLIFVQTIERTRELADEIQVAARVGVSSGVGGLGNMHGNGGSKGAGPSKLQGVATMSSLPMAIMNSRMTSDERDEVVMKFRLGKIWILITTEVLARGMDFKNVGTVINFDFPLTVESYVHRVGRAGRGFGGDIQEGKAYTFFTDLDKERLPEIAQTIADSGQFVEPWILALRPPNKKRRRELKKSAPERPIVSTEKRIQTRTKRLDREYKRAGGGPTAEELEEAHAAEMKGEQQEGAEGGDAEDDDDHGEEGGAGGKKPRRLRRQGKRPRQSESDHPGAGDDGGDD